MKMKTACLLMTLAALSYQGEALRIQLNGAPVFNHRELSWPRWSGALQDPWEGILDTINSFDVATHFDDLLNAFDEPLWPSLAGSKSSEIKNSCHDRPTPGELNGWSSSEAEGRLTTNDQQARAPSDKTPDPLGEWEKQQVELWERDYLKSRDNWERQQQAKRDQFLRRLEAEKKARAEQEKIQRRLQEQREEHERIQKRVEEQRAERQRELEKQRQEHERLIKEAEKQKYEAEKRLRELRESTTQIPRPNQAEDKKPHQPKRFVPDHVPTRPAKKQRSLKMEDSSSEVGTPSKILSLYVSGYKPEEVSVKLDGKKVRIQGKHHTNDEETGMLVSEFDRTYVLPEGVDTSTIKATFKSGVLKLEGIKTERSSSLKSHSHNEDHRDMEHSSVVTKDNNSYRELRINNGQNSSQPKYKKNAAVQHSIYRNNGHRDYDDDDVSIEVVE